ncbi:MAG: Asp-tRNA(Asn)/Glu-tRNA(Gln) amidotransferase subunit GatC [Candidatus Omnitrophota bacterium]|nr:Asp-tRNA(Asn)/Glu-tRNA(Gln) amidotransferase subunit GatC [Candidatus Omnitrophota bacterium]
MALDDKTVEYVARLARIELQPRELEKLSRQLQGILDFIDKLNRADIRGVSPTSHVLAVNNVFREDIGRQSLATEKVLENAPRKQGDFYVVPKVIE